MMRILTSIALLAISGLASADIIFNWEAVTEDVNGNPIAASEMQYIITHSNGTKFSQIIAAGDAVTATASGVDAEPGDVYCIRPQKLGSFVAGTASCVEVPDTAPKQTTTLGVN